MELAKPRIDVGLFTNRLEPMLAFWQQDVGLAFDHMIGIGGGVRQHRHDMLGSVLKLNHARDPLPPDRPSGYQQLLIARRGLSAPEPLVDPDGNRILLVPPGVEGVRRIGVRMRVRDPAAHRRFLVRALGCHPLDGSDAGVFCGDSLILLEPGGDTTGDAGYRAPGFRYITLQVFDVDAAHRAVLDAGGGEGLPPVTMGATARVSFIRDPDGNWIELSERASVTGRPVS
ncbi:MAG: VOC family protein [Ectothiorhodospiraceae bacterium]|nr:VOC family protein [Ectothiorhodospiraceae bacterium]